MASDKYGYFVLVNGQKRYGGSITAGSMEDAAHTAALVCGLRIKKSPSVVRPCDGAIIPIAEWTLEGDPALVAVWADATKLLSRYPSIKVDQLALKED